MAATADTDYGIAAQIAAAFTGAFYTTPTGFAPQDSPNGIQYTEKLRSSKKSYHVAVTAALESDFPTLPHSLRALAQALSGCVVYYRAPKKLCKFFKKPVKTSPDWRSGLAYFAAQEKTRMSTKASNSSTTVRRTGFCVSMSPLKHCALAPRVQQHKSPVA